MILLLAHFPTLYPDELLYSGIARYHLLSGNFSQKQTVRDLYHGHLVCATVDLPSHVKQLSVLTNNVYSVDTLIRNHTLFPYYESFMDNFRSRSIYSLMEESSVLGKVHSSLGLAACRIRLPMYLKFCMDCYKKDISQYNEPYWHRVHQLPAVYMCPIHSIELIETDVLYSTNDQKFRFVPLVQVVTDCCRQISTNLDWRDALLRIAVKSKDLLYSSGRNPQQYNIYRDILKGRGYVTPGDHIRFVQLISDFCTFFPEGLLRFLNSNISLNITDSWLHKMLRGKAPLLHPLRHLFMGLFLNTDAMDREAAWEHPFKIGPWPCLNKASTHYMEDVIQNCKVSNCSKTGVPVGTFRCSCGFVYSRRGPDRKFEDRFRVGRIKTFGSVWMQRLIEINKQDLSLRAKATVLGVDHSTVRNQTLRLGMPRKASPMQADNRELILRRERYLESMLDAVKKDVSVRQLNSKDYSWLYRNDRMWLQKMRTTGIKKPIENARIDWSMRDRQALGEVKKAVQVIRQSSKPQRVTLAEIMRNLDKLVVPYKMNKCINKLPETKKFVNKEVEDTEQFQIRRLRWAAEQLKSREFRILNWKLLKVAGLNRPLSTLVKVEFNKLIQ